MTRRFASPSRGNAGSGAGSAVFVAMVIALTANAFAPTAAAASRPRVEAVAVDAVTRLGSEAPLAVLTEYARGVSLGRIVREIRGGKLPEAAGGPTSSSTPAGTTPAGGGIVVTDKSLTPSIVEVHVGDERVVSNQGSRTHQLQVLHTGQPPFGLEPGATLALDFSEYAPGTYTLAVVDGGTTGASVTIVVRAPIAGVRDVVGVREVSTRSEAPPTMADIAEMIAVIREETVAELAGESLFTPAESASIRAASAKEQKDRTAPVGDPRTLQRKASKAEIDVAAAFLTQGIVLAARNGYSADQITAAILELELSVADPDHFLEVAYQRWPAFVFAGLIFGVDPAGDSVDGVLARGPKVTSGGSSESPSSGAQPSPGSGARYEGGVLDIHVTHGARLVKDQVVVSVGDAGLTGHISFRQYTGIGSVSGFDCNPLLSIDLDIDADRTTTGYQGVVSGQIGRGLGDCPSSFPARLEDVRGQVTVSTAPGVPDLNGRVTTDALTFRFVARPA